MLRVRFPSGMVIQYNSATYLSQKEIGWDLYENKDEKKWVASIQLSAGAVVEAIPACRVYNETESELAQSVGDQLESVKRLIRRRTTHK